MESTTRNNSFATAAFKTLEDKRKHLAHQVQQYQILLFASILGLVMTIVASVNHWWSAYPDIMPFLFGGTAIFSLIYSAYSWNKLSTKYLNTVKAPVLDKIFKDQQLDWTAYPIGYIDEHFVNRTNLFRSSPTNVSSTRYLEGRYRDHWMTCNQVECTQGQGKNKSTLFSGVILQMNFDNKVNGTTVVLPDTAQSILGKTLGKKMQSWKSHNGLNLVYFQDDHIFEKEYVVYANYEEEARMLLADEIRKKLKELGQTYSKNVFISVQPKTVTIAISGLSMFTFGVKNSLMNQQLMDNIQQDVTWVGRMLDIFID